MRLWDKVSIAKELYKVAWVGCDDECWEDLDSVSQEPWLFAAVWVLDHADVLCTHKES